MDASVARSLSSANGGGWASAPTGAARCHPGRTPVEGPDPHIIGRDQLSGRLPARARQGEYRPRRRPGGRFGRTGGLAEADPGAGLRAGHQGLLPPSLEFTVGLDSLGTPIRAHLVPGQIDDVALVVAGVHGSEQSGVEVADRLLAQLQVTGPSSPCHRAPALSRQRGESRRLGEEARRRPGQDRRQASTARFVPRTTIRDGSRLEKGRRTRTASSRPSAPTSTRPNPLIPKGDPVEPGNIALMALIKQFGPKRLVSIHAQKDLKKAGIFADPHPSAAPGPLATAADDLAIAAAKRAAGPRGQGGRQHPRRWILQPVPRTESQDLRGEDGEENAKGQSLGQWGPSKGIMVLTVEVSEQYTSTGAVNDPKRGAELEGEATAFREVVLGPPPAAVPGHRRCTGDRNRCAGAAAGPGATLGDVPRCGRSRQPGSFASAAHGPLPPPDRHRSRTPARRQQNPVAATRPAEVRASSAVPDVLSSAASPPSPAAPARRSPHCPAACGTSRSGLPPSGLAQAHGDERGHRSRHPDRCGVRVSSSGDHRTHPQPQAQGGQSVAEGKEIIRREVVLPAIERYRPETVLSAAELAKKVRRAEQAGDVRRRGDGPHPDGRRHQEDHRRRRSRVVRPARPERPVLGRADHKRAWAAPSAASTRSC